MTGLEDRDDPRRRRTSAQERIAEIISGYGADSVVRRFIRCAAPETLSSVQRIEVALAAQPR